MASVTAGGSIAARAAAYGIPAHVVDGNDVFAVHGAASDAADRARGGAGPTLLECETYRHFGHSKSDPGAYRPKDEVERWLGRDPLDIARARLLEMGASEANVEGVENAAREQIDRAIEGALAAPFPDPGEHVATEFAP